MARSAEAGSRNALAARQRWQAPLALLVAVVGNGLWLLVLDAAMPGSGFAGMAPFTLAILLPTLSLVLPIRPLVRFAQHPRRHWLDGLFGVPALAIALAAWRIGLRTLALHYHVSWLQWAS